MAIKVITPPANEPITATEAKLHTRIDAATEDSLINIWIASGRELAEKFQNRALINQTLELTLDRWPVSPFGLPMPPLQDDATITRIQYYDTDNIEYTFDRDDYFMDTDSEPGRIALAYGKHWPMIILRPISGIKIRYQAGYGATAADVPQNVRDAILLYVTYRYEHRAEELDVESAPVQFYQLLWPDRMVPV